MRTVDEMKATLTRYIQLSMEMAERETDEVMAQAHLKDAQEALVKYRLLTSTTVAETSHVLEQYRSAGIL